MGKIINFKHPLGKEKYSKVLSVQEISVNGGTFSWKQVKNDKIPGFILRTKIDNISDVQLSFAGGISDNPLSNHYKNMLVYWQKDIFMKPGSDDHARTDKELKLLPEK